MDLVCVVADKNMEAAIEQLFERPKSLGTRVFKPKIVIHPEHDSGCFHNSEKVLKYYLSAEHALVILDYDWAEFQLLTVQSSKTSWSNL